MTECQISFFILIKFLFLKLSFFSSFTSGLRQDVPYDARRRPRATPATLADPSQAAFPFSLSIRIAEETRARVVAKAHR